MHLYKQFHYQTMSFGSEFCRRVGGEDGRQRMRY